MRPNGSILDVKFGIEFRIIDFAVAASIAASAFEGIQTSLASQEALVALLHSKAFSLDSLWIQMKQLGIVIALSRETFTDLVVANAEENM